jgi:hypothetical protein
MALTNYTELKTAIADFLNRSDLTSQIPDFITLAEAQMQRKLSVPDMTGDVTLTISGEFTQIPADFAGVKSFRLVDTHSANLEFRREDEFDRFDYQGFGKPQFYTRAGENFQFWPFPGGDQPGSYQARLRYRKYLPALSADNPSNWVLDLHPDAYLYGALVQSAPYLKDDERVATWTAFFRSAIADINEDGRRQNQGATLQVSSNGPCP